MRSITAITIIMLTAMLAFAMASGASNLVTTLIAIPLGSIAGFSGSFIVAGRLMDRAARNRRQRRSTAVVVAPRPSAKVIVLHPQRRPAPQRTQLLLAA